MDSPGGRQRRHARKRVRPARRGVLIVNPRSGDGKAERADLVAKAEALGVRTIVLSPDDDLRALAEQAAADGADVLGMAGGDGSQALVADVARRHGLAFVCVPAGTRNHFALDLGLDRDDVAAALDAFGEAIEQRIDLALVGDEVFVNNVSLGVYGKVVQSGNYRDAKIATAAQILPELLSPDTEPFDLRFTGPEGTTAKTADVLLVSNNAYHLTSLSQFGTRARLDAGMLGIVTVTANRNGGLRALLSAESEERVDHFPGYREWTVREFEVGSGDELLDVGIDGEARKLAPPLRFRSLPGALRVRVPRREEPAGFWRKIRNWAKSVATSATSVLRRRSRS
ncbi:diacylglycerol/lipid kinase family protein [Amycolatopsis pithecellobii]|uniref:Diacylglycerol kinase n=1 Tax=Amycolatopsis pithecellobii TaxID=664692 RepID=A0A6N7Z9I7_9PSEU|nr:diacylglycerol kinase family protein [Amycolatopsis pithecellobii]MTD58391.1 diacylglycerol kinase [Amycolatopsis pithecellobii]